MKLDRRHVHDNRAHRQMPHWSDPTALKPPRPSGVRWTEPPDTATPACLGDPAMWEATDPELISWARAACLQCPALAWCQNETKRLVTAGMDLVGVWAAVSYPASGGE